MIYLKCRTNTGQYLDPDTQILIPRGQIVPVKRVSRSMKTMLQKKGLLEVTEAEYLQWKGQQPKIIPPVEVIVAKQEEKLEKPIEDELEKEEAAPPPGGMVTTPNLGQKVSEAKVNKFFDKINKKNQPSKE